MRGLAPHVVNARTHWFERCVRNSNPAADRSELSHTTDLGIWTTSDASTVEVRTILELDGDSWSMRFELGAQFQFEEGIARGSEALAEFIRDYGGPFILGMIREAVLDASRQVGLPSVLLPFHLEETIRGMRDADLLQHASDRK